MSEYRIQSRLGITSGFVQRLDMTMYSVFCPAQQQAPPPRRRYDGRPMALNVSALLLAAEHAVHRAGRLAPWGQNTEYLRHGDTPDLGVL